jgi:hypothetical protein
MQQMRNPRHILVLLCYWRIAGCDLFNGIPQGLACFSMRLEPMSSMSCLSTSQHTSLWKGFTTVQQICCALWHGCSCQCQGPLTYKLEFLKVNTLIFDHPFPFNLGDIWRDNSRKTRGKEHVRSKDHIWGVTKHSNVPKSSLTYVICKLQQMIGSLRCDMVRIVLKVRVMPIEQKRQQWIAVSTTFVSV